MGNGIVLGQNFAPLLPQEAVTKAIAVRCHQAPVGAGKWIGNRTVSVTRDMISLLSGSLSLDFPDIVSG